MPLPKDIDSISSYLRAWAPELGERILQTYPPLQGFEDAASPLVAHLLRKPFPAQTLAIMGVVKRWNQARGAAVIAECGTGKTLISLGAVRVHSERKPFTALAMVPPQLVDKWAREAFLSLPGVRVFFIDGLRTPTSSVGHAGVNEVRLRHGRIVREGLRTTLTELRLRKAARTARQRWDSICGSPALFIVGRDRGKLSYFWRHAYGHARCGRYQGSVINSDTGCPIYLVEDGERLLSDDFKKAKLSEILGARNGDESAKLRRALYSALWQADGTKTRRFAPVDFIGRYMTDFFDYAIADEVHELKGDTAQGNALGTLAACAQRTVVLTGTLLGGYADEVFNILYRVEPSKMVAEGFEYGEAGVRTFTETYGLLEKITVIEPADNACSEARVTKRIRRRPGASPLLFGRFLMSLGAFISLEDISEALPPYREEVVSVEMDAPLKQAYKKLEEDVKTALKEHRGNQSVMSVALNALLLYPDRPFRLGNLYGWEYDPETQRRERFLIAETLDLAESMVYAKERRLVEEVKAELAHGRRCQIYAVYTQKRDVTRRLEHLLSNEGIRVAVLTTEVPPESREGWYDRQLRGGIQAVICHPKLVQTGLDLIDFPTILFYETGYSIYGRLFVNRSAYTLQSSRPHPESGRHYYFRPKAKGTGEELSLTTATIGRHLEGELTIGLYAINPATQRSKWVAIDADYASAMEDLLKLQYSLQQDEVEAALEMSKRGGHLWIFMERPALARECRIYIYNLALKLGMRIKGIGLGEGIEIFPKHDELREGEFGNAIRGPLGVHRGANRRYWFYGADYDLEGQIAYLNRLRKVSEEQLRTFIAGKTMPPEFERKQPATDQRFVRGSAHEFRILDHVGKVRKVGRNYVTQCPSCAETGQDRSRDNLAISIDDPRKYICWAGCTKEMIRSAVGCPIPVRRSA